MIHVLAKRSRGLTVIEVLFAVAIVMVGLVGIAIMVPFAIRQSRDAYQTTQALNTGENALALMRAEAVITPKMELLWQYVDDSPASIGDSSSTGFVSMTQLYQFIYNQKVAAGMPAALAQNQTIGSCFCMDPLFWGYQPRLASKLGDRALLNYRRTRFPYFHERYPTSMNPQDGSNAQFDSPRMFRVSLRDPYGPDGNGNNGWLRLPTAIKMATIDGSDIVDLKSSQEKTSIPIRGELASSDGSLGRQVPPNGLISWMATIAPSDSTPIIQPRMLNAGTPPPLEFFPESYDLSVVVFARRDVRETLSPTGAIPKAERLARVIGFGPETMTSGAFDITLGSFVGVDATIKIGDWLMLSRYIFDNPVTNSGLAEDSIRQRHKWYRVISVSGAEQFPKQIRVAGAPWDWTEHEIDEFKRQNILSLPPASALPATVATIMPDVVNVYQRSVVLNVN